MGAVLWCGTAFLLYRVVEPIMSPDGGRTFLFDPVALVEATSIIVSVAMLSWVLIRLLIPRMPGLLLALVATASTWAFLGVPFALIDKLGVVDVTRFRAAAVMENGDDLAFLPLLIPLISVFSGVAYSVAIWVARRFTRTGQH